MIHFNDFDFEKLHDEIEKDGLIKKTIRKDDKTKEDLYYSNTIFTLDIETTSYFITEQNEIMMFDETLDNEFYKTTRKQALMYIWMFGINDIVIYGRTGDELKQFIDKLNKELIYDNIIIHKIIYVHNLGFDFHFIQNWLGVHWDVFAREPNKPITAKDEYIEFRCSYFLTNMSLDNFAKTYKLNVQKQLGKLDYNVFRTPLTPMTDDELLYCEYDIKVLYEIIKMHRTKHRSILAIPLTQTGKIRNQIDHIFYKNYKHHKNMKNAAPSNFDDFKLLCQVYSGGYTHSNKLHTNKTLSNIVSYDIGSSYPFECVTKKFPMTQFLPLTKKCIYELNNDATKTLNDYIDFNNQAFIIDFYVNDLVSLSSNNFLSLHKAVTQKFFDDDEQENMILTGLVADNGRIERCKSGRFIMTDVDFLLFLQAYDFSKLVVNKIFVAEKDYLPKELILYILQLYEDKTKLKGIESEEVKYQEIKQFLNGIYGMFVTKIIQDDVIYKNGEMTKETIDYLVKEKKITRKEAEKELLIKANEKLSKYSDRKNINLNFAWGVWVSSFARSGHLWRNILKIGNDVVYCDTDSIKCFNSDKIKKIFEEDNKIVKQDIAKVCLHYDLDPSLFSPLGKTIGLFELDATYANNGFRTLGAKKYCYIKENETELKLTVSGLNKNTGPSRLEKIDDFKPGVLFNYNQAGKSEAYYLHDQETIQFEDGWIETSKYGVCIKPTTYYLDITVDYEDILDIASSLLD